MINNLNQEIIYFLIEKKPTTTKELVDLIRHKCGQSKQNPVAKEKLLQAYQELLKGKKINPDENLLNLLKKRAIRTLSGVAPVTIMTAPLNCPNNCLYCPSQKNMPKSYLSSQPAAMRAVLLNFHPYQQTSARLRALRDNGHQTEKIEIIINGGTWSAHPKTYQAWFLCQIFKAVNEFSLTNNNPASHTRNPEIKKILQNNLDNLSLTELKELTNDNDDVWFQELLKEQKKNETALNRIIGITLETRPDFITPEEIKRLRWLGATKIEIGVQSIDDEVLLKNRRGHNNSITIKATKLLKTAGFKVAYHLMPGLFGSDFQKDLLMFQEIFSQPQYKPDFIKIYPCVVVENTDLEKLYQEKIYQPYSEEKLIDLLSQIKINLPRYTRLVRLARDIPSNDVIAGNKTTNLRELVLKKMKKEGKTCLCIRCREPKNQTVDLDKIKFNYEKITVTDAEEYFLSFDSLDGKILYAFLRLRLPQTEDNDLNILLPELKNSALIREIHTYGKLTNLNEQNNKTVQHLGLGKRLMLEAENISKKSGFSKITVISGIGVREYYKKLGYHLEETYMTKNI